jgi:carboxyl-terminal processing protease
MTRLLFAFLCFSFYNINAQDIDFCHELKSIKDLVQSSHYQPKPVNDSLSKHVHKLFLDQIDGDKHFFTRANISEFKKDELQLDDYLVSNTCDFINSYAEILQERINKSKIILESLRTETLVYNGQDSLHYSTDRIYDYFKDENSVKRYWNKKVRYKILRKLVENDSVLEQIKSNFKTLETSIKQKIIDNEICLLNELEQSNGNLQNFVQTSFLDAFLKYQDPNSSYLSSSDKNLFEQSVTSSQLSFGITTTKKANGDIVIASIAPGSSAFKNGNFEVNDVIITLNSGKELLETYCTSNETITSFLNNAEINAMSFKIKKQSGQIKEVELTKNEVNSEDNVITGYVLSGEINIGYINIPSFYTDLESVNGLGVSNDVAKQIYKLQRETIEGLIIDLRFNGGGSMKEAADLSGMFIDRGPVAISTVRDEPNYTIKDPNRGTIFTKPIVLLVNQFSASASEFFAGAMQDYNRALIVGSATHGKATSQLIVPVDAGKSSSFVKLTMGQFFRVTGKSHQQVGLTPDIVLPNIYDNYETQEASLPFSMPNTTTTVTLKHRPKLKKDISKLKSESLTRIEHNSAFKAIKVFNEVFVNDYINREGSYPLSLNFVFNDNKNYFDAYNRYSKTLDKNATIFSVINTASTNAILSYNSEDQLLNKTHRAMLAKDPYIQEAFLITKTLLDD